MPQKIAQFLKLTNPELYTGHCFRRTSATLLIDAGGDITALKRHGGWKSTAVAEGYVDTSIANKMNTAHKIASSVIPETYVQQPTTCAQGSNNFSIPCIINENKTFQSSNVHPHPISITNYGTMTINFANHSGSNLI